MNNFDKIILQYARKRVDVDNPQIVTYKAKKRLTMNHNLLNGDSNVVGRSKKRKTIISTPAGMYDNIEDAAAAHGIHRQTMYKWIRTKKDFTEIKDD